MKRLIQGQTTGEGGSSEQVVRYKFTEARFCSC